MVLVSRARRSRHACAAGLARPASTPSPAASSLMHGPCQVSASWLALTFMSRSRNLPGSSRRGGAWCEPDLWWRVRAAARPPDPRSVMPFLNRARPQKQCGRSVTAASPGAGGCRGRGFKDPSADRCLCLKLAESFVVQLPTRSSVNVVIGPPGAGRAGRPARPVRAQPARPGNHGHDGANQPGPCIVVERGVTWRGLARHAGGGDPKMPARRCS